MRVGEEAELTAVTETPILLGQLPSSVKECCFVMEGGLKRCQSRLLTAEV
jgi:hypothetical protein